MIAMYKGRCRNCGGAITPGEEIKSISRGVAEHVQCPANPVQVEERQPRKPAVDKVGVYETPEGKIYTVTLNKKKTGTYAKEVVEIGGVRTTDAGIFVNVEFRYARGVIYSLTPEMKMTGARAQELTLRYGRCIVCGRFLKAAESVLQGIGPVCVQRFPDLVEERKAIKANVKANVQPLNQEPMFVVEAAKLYDPETDELEDMPEDYLGSVFSG
jgi:hypothetical protein